MASKLLWTGLYLTLLSQAISQLPALVGLIIMGIGLLALISDR